MKAQIRNLEIGIKKKFRFEEILSRSHKGFLFAFEKRGSVVNFFKSLSIVIICSFMFTFKIGIIASLDFFISKIKMYVFYFELITIIINFDRIKKETNGQDLKINSNWLCFILRL